MDLQTLLQTMVNRRASDLHIRAGGPAYLRVDGELVTAAPDSIAAAEVEGMLASILSQRAKGIFADRGEVDFGFQAGEVARFRVNVFRQRGRLAVAIRFIPTVIPSFQDLRLPVDIMRHISENGRGLVLVTGITGSGKSSTLAAMVDYINETRAEHILTIEDPVEFVHKDRKGILSQREIGADTPTYAEGLRMALRQDPDVILVGEMRDPETIAMTLMAAETGHLVFSTLHTRDAVGTITRILDYFPEGRQQEVRNQLSLGLRYIVSQKLIPRKDGKGRIAAMEILNNNYATANLIRTGKVEQIYSQLQTKTRNGPDEKMITMESHLAKLVKTDKLDLLEAQKWANNIGCFLDAMKRD